MGSTTTTITLDREAMIAALTLGDVDYVTGVHQKAPFIPLDAATTEQLEEAVGYLHNGYPEEYVDRSVANAGEIPFLYEDKWIILVETGMAMALNGDYVDSEHGGADYYASDEARVECSRCGEAHHPLESTVTRFGRLCAFCLDEANDEAMIARKEEGY